MLKSGTDLLATILVLKLALEVVFSFGAIKVTKSSSHMLRIETVLWVAKNI
jgi:hypothetical protein